ncbi:mevalonate kinase-like protein [Encephalitozoon romaleae SJ-2008]|uniref:phosphomevalonate kinase n=1 Tax=Encephalitozoon romaleae (strain SJ-2008) TaxID=1178016 RepID=I6ZW20_ENCRO|nr:mevalonate kinase-like protein [Encephalitozoon romaleae SJ-2008]AFN83956.1 mevalonate kinase-like protein [Encephalitozoon romaleae SJ-2008]
MNERIQFKVPGKVIVNGSYIVLNGETCRAIALKTYILSETTRIVSDKPEITIEINGKEKSTYCYEDYESSIINGPDCYLLKIVDCFFRITGISPKNIINIKMKAEDGFFINGPTREKTGIGSSACILVSIVYALLKFHQEDLEKIILQDSFNGWGKSPRFQGDLRSWLGHLSLSEEIVEHVLPVTYLVHQKVNQEGSGSDAICCLLGSIYFNRKTCVPMEKIPRYLVLGSFGKSTSTKEMLKRIDLEDPRWESLKAINFEINRGRVCQKYLYMEYLNAMRDISIDIVPKKQYEILMKTSEYDIWGCGISGAGGDDCIWAISDDYKDVYRYWEKVFTFTFVTEVSYRGICLM